MPVMLRMTGKRGSGKWGNPKREREYSGRGEGMYVYPAGRRGCRRRKGGITVMASCGSANYE